jgi:hypothetical protein
MKVFYHYELFSLLSLYFDLQVIDQYAAVSMVSSGGHFMNPPYFPATRACQQALD